MNDEQSQPKLEKLLRQWGAESAASGEADGAADIPPEVLAAVPGAAEKRIIWRRWVPVAAAAAVVMLVAGYLLGVARGPQATRQQDDLQPAVVREVADPAASRLAAAQDAHRAEIERLRTVYEQQLRQQRTEHQAALRALEAGRDTAAREAERLAREWAKNERQLAEAREQLEAVRSEVAKAGEESGRLKEELARLQLQREADLTNHYRDREAIEAKLRTELGQAERLLSTLENRLRESDRLAAQMRQRWIDGQPVPQELVAAERERFWTVLAKDAEGLLARAAEVRAAAKAASTRELVDRAEAVLTQMALRTGEAEGETALARAIRGLDLTARMMAIYEEDREPEEVWLWLADIYAMLGAIK